jgi:hypothetical protein
MGLQVTEVQKALKGADYPAQRDDLAQLAEEHGDRDVAEALRNSGRGEFGGPDDVMEALKGQLGGDA